MTAIAGDSKSCLEESSEEADARKSYTTGGAHAPGPQRRCGACKVLKSRAWVNEPIVRQWTLDAWAGWHRITTPPLRERFLKWLGVL